MTSPEASPEIAVGKAPKKPIPKAVEACASLQESLRVSAGIKGPANTFTHVHVWDLRLTGEQPLALPLPEGYTTLLVVLKGSAQIGAEKIGGAGRDF
jgi:redox-sensitive bicupin YhaK (pirin superfamily)